MAWRFWFRFLNILTLTATYMLKGKVDWKLLEVSVRPSQPIMLTGTTSITDAYIIIPNITSTLILEVYRSF